MLAISTNAAEAIRTIVSAPEVLHGAGLRIATLPDADPPDSLELSLAVTPALSDHILIESGALVFVEERAIPLLDEMVLDARVDGPHVGFTICDRVP